MDAEELSRRQGRRGPELVQSCPIALTSGTFLRDRVPPFLIKAGLDQLYSHGAFLFMRFNFVPKSKAANVVVHICLY